MSAACPDLSLLPRWYYIVVVPTDQATGSLSTRWRSPDEMELDQVGVWEPPGALGAGLARGWRQPGRCSLGTSGQRWLRGKDSRW